jgi:competence protein ComK
MKGIENLNFRDIAVIYFDLVSYTTKIITIKGLMITLPSSLEESLDLLCTKAGSTLEGRTVAFKRITGITQKPAILISEISHILLMPTKALSNPDCIVINYSSLINASQDNYFNTNLKFYNNFEYGISVNRRIIKNQCLRCYEFLHLINGERIEDDNKKFLMY